MPFKKQSNGKYKSPSGKEMTKEQVQAYYASQGDKKKPKKKKK
jgi:hypothetical protein